MFIEFNMGSGRTLLNARHIVQVKRKLQDLGDTNTEITLANGEIVIVTIPYEEVCIKILRAGK